MSRRAGGRRSAAERATSRDVRQAEREVTGRLPECSTPPASQSVSNPAQASARVVRDRDTVCSLLSHALL
jgi:hypothetical protein